MSGLIPTWTALSAFPLFVEKIGWVLVHSIWQFSFIAALVFLADRVLKRSSASNRYFVLMIGMCSFALVPAVTWWTLPSDHRSPPVRSPAPLAASLARDHGTVPAGDVTTAKELPPGQPASVANFKMSSEAGTEVVVPSPTRSWTEAVANAVRPRLAGIVGVWCLGVLLFSLRPAWSWCVVGRLRSVGISPVTESVRNSFVSIRRRLGVTRRVCVLQSTLVSAPVVVGCFRSVILLPMSFIGSVPVSQLEAILAHELAHVRRYDYAVNLLQTLIETLSFYHPAVWWLSHRMRIERENCCDDLVVSALGDGVSYGRALLAVEEFRAALVRPASSGLALGTNGGSLLNRIRRLLPDPVRDDQRVQAGPAVPAVLLTGCLLALIWASTAIDAQDPSRENDRKETTSFVAKITDDVSVELVAIHSHGGGPTDLWQADGSRFETPPPVPAWRDTAHQIDDDNRHLFFRWKGLDQKVGLTHLVPGWWMQLNPDESGMARIITRLPEDGDVVTVRIGMTDEEWGPWQKVDRNGKVISPVDIPAACLDAYERIKPDHTQERVGACLFCWTGMKGVEDRAQSQIVAVTSDGQRRNYDGRTAWESPAGTESAEVFDLPLNDVDHFEYRLRPYRHWATFENVSLRPEKLTEVKVSVESIPIPKVFGLESHGLRARLVALHPGVNPEKPDLDATGSDFERSDDMTFGIELKNVGDRPISLAGLRYGDGFAAETRGQVRTNRLAPHLFEFEFTDAAGRPVPRVERRFHQAWFSVSSASVHELAPGQSLVEVLRPAEFYSPMDYDFPSGRYRLRIRYHGISAADREHIREHVPESPILKTWAHEVATNAVAFSIEQGTRRPSPDELVWGPEQGGLRAAIEYRVSDETTADPAQAPGVPVGTHVGVVFHVRNVGDKPIAFVSETLRQGDAVHVTDERGENVAVKDVFFTGWPIDVAWQLNPGEIAQLHLLTPSLNSIEQPGKYNVSYTIRFNGRIRKDDAGNVIFPRPGDYDRELETGVTPLFLHAAQPGSAGQAKETDIRSATSAGRAQITEDAELEITQRVFHGTDVMTNAIIRWNRDPEHPRHLPLSIAADYFANRQRWTAVWEHRQPVLWLAKGLGSGPGRQIPPEEKVKIEDLRRIDFGDPDCIVSSSFSGWVQDRLPSSVVRAALETAFIIPSKGAENFRYYEPALPGMHPADDNVRLHVYIKDDGECRIDDPVWEMGESREVACTLETLPETLALIAGKVRLKKGENVTLSAFIAARPDLPSASLRMAIEACRQNAIVAPTDAPETGRNAGISPWEPRWREAWRDYYAAQTDDDRGFLRKAVVDLIGQTATDERLARFVRDPAPDKRIKLIDGLLDDEAWTAYQSRIHDENDAFQTTQSTLPARILRGPQAKMRRDVYRHHHAGRPVDGLILDIALRTASNRFRIGERIPLDVILSNATDENMTRDFSFDFIANPPRVVDESGKEIPIESLFLTGLIPLHRETLRPGDSFIYPHIGLGLGDNSHPEEFRHPHTPPLQPGKYRLSQQWGDLHTGEIEFEIVPEPTASIR